MEFKFSEKLSQFLAAPGIEGVVLHPYLDSVNVPTIGIGTTTYPDGKKVTMQDATITLQQAYDYCLNHLSTKVLPTVNKSIVVPLNQNQVDAIGSLVYNIGITGFSTSSVLKSINNKAPLEEIHSNWAKWNKAGGKVVNGLVNRREAEFQLFKS